MGGSSTKTIDKFRGTLVFWGKVVAFVKLGVEVREYAWDVGVAILVPGNDVEFSLNVLCEDEELGRVVDAVVLDAAVEALAVANVVRLSDLEPGTLPPSCPTITSPRSSSS